MSQTPLSLRYPPQWWMPVLDPEKPWWEILPQEAKPGEVILSKRGELGVLSNFTATPFEFHGRRYASVEGFWQMQFYPESADDPRARARGLSWPHTREQVGQMTSHEAKVAGDIGMANMQALDIDWVSFEGRRMKYWDPTPGEHYRLTREVLRAKLEQNPRVREILLATGDLFLRPDHYRPEDAPPSWKYDEIWMEIRSELGGERS
jgi:predicted NAD-dependent protein-ADP-ribosyltransferase YbiA (DUF1768 family)